MFAKGDLRGTALDGGSNHAAAGTASKTLQEQKWAATLLLPALELSLRTVGALTTHADIESLFYEVIAKLDTFHGSLFIEQ